MACFIKVLLPSRLPFIISKRFRGKINIQKPRKPHFERQLLIDFSKPVYGPPKYSIPEIQLCDRGKKKRKVEVDNPFERILARECLDWFNTSKMVIFLHLNSITMEDKMPVFAALRKNNMHLRSYGKKIVEMATVGTRYEAVNALFTSHQNIIFGQPEGINKLFSILKKTPQLVIMAGIIQDKLMSKNELVEFSKLPNLDLARSQLCSILQSAGSSLVSKLNQSPQTFVSHLDKYVEIQNNLEKNTADTENSAIKTDKEP